ncbi:GNAT family N-acetyltransferase [Nocardia sp. NPDC051463]|uniref:GNAT family N-acetyltransferase n=1 Tax=Nocardia sp. NPDC051463 TaxID=3154845 RepID=UPI0034138F4E
MNELPSSVTLEELSEENLRSLLDAAVADADPFEVMAAVDGPPGWTLQRRHAFVEFHRGRALHPTRPSERTFVITVDGETVGAARLEPHGNDLEAGIWIGRSHRGRGIGSVVTARLHKLAAETGASRITATTTQGNVAARRLIDTGPGARVQVDGDAVTGVCALTRASA